MSKRDRARRRRNRAREYDEQFGPDPAQVVYAWPDGWSIRWPGSVEGLVREGVLTDTCFKGMQDGLAEGIVNSEDADYWAFVITSLREVDNIPKLTFLHIPGNEHEPGYTGELLGFQNSPPKPEYLERIEEWHDGLPYDVTVIEIPELRVAA